MNEFWILILVALFATNSLDKAKSVKVKLEETPLKTFDEIFGEGWWDKGEAEDLKTPAPTNFGQNVHHQIDRQNTQIRQIEPNSTDQNPPLTEYDHSENAKNGEELIAEDERKRKIVDKFLAIKDEFKQKGKYSKKEWTQIEKKIEPQHKYSHNEQKELMKSYYEIKNQNSKIRDKDIAKMLKIGKSSLYIWKKQFKQQQFHQNSVDGLSVEDNAAANVQEIGTNSGNL
uniref:Uncharacterized protein n=1 Tax=Globodera rostochiensis TaxID=31243 RepID=A0A914HR24_GLORO